MAIIGLKYPVYAILTDGATPSWATGSVIGKAISSNISIDGGDTNILYADDASAESDTSFQGGTVEIGVDDLSDEVYADLLGHTITKGVTSEPDVLTAKASDAAPYVGVGFYKTRKKGGAVSYRATWLTKVQFGEPSDEATTKGESVEWQTPTITGNIMTTQDDMWKKQATFDTEAAAKTWLNGLAGITGV